MKGTAPASGHQLCLGARDCDVRRPSTTSSISGSSSEDVRARAGLPQAARPSTGARPDNTVLANEQVDRRRLLALRHCRSRQRDLEQWSFRITEYAEELLKGLRHADRNGPSKVLSSCSGTGLGSSEGARLTFPDLATLGGIGIDDLHHAHRHHLRRNLRAAGTRASRSFRALCGPESPDPAAFLRAKAQTIPERSIARLA